MISLEKLRREFVQRSGSGLVRKKSVLSAVDGLTFHVEPGEAVGYIGANGSGKSTTIKMLTGILTPTSGTVRVCGLDPVPQRKQLARHLGVLFGQRSLLWWDLPLHESFPILAAMYRRPTLVWKARFDALIDGLELSTFLDRPVRNLSLGQRMRGELAAALIHEPELIILDEPTIGLDMISKERLRSFLNHERAERGTTLLLTTHDMGDVQRLCERMIIIDHGKQVFDGTEAALQAETGAERVLHVDIAGDANAYLKERTTPLTLPTGAHIIAAEGPQLSVSFSSGELTAAQLLASVSAQVQVIDMRLAEPEIEDLVKRIYVRNHDGS